MIRIIKLLNIVFLFSLVLAFWVILTGSLNVSDVVLGAIISGLTAAICGFVYEYKVANILSTTVRFIFYFLWLLKEIAKSSFEVSMKMWRLDPEISPKAEWIRTNLKDDISIAIYANSVTLTPGTVAISTGDKGVYIHCLTERYLKEQNHNNLLQRVAKITNIGGR